MRIILKPVVGKHGVCVYVERIKVSWNRVTKWNLP
jgi:hypothetical protein